MTLTVSAPAKVNLFLHVLGRRADGYHELQSLAVLCGAADRVNVAPAADLQLALAGPFAAALAGESDNLVLRAARFLARRANVPAAAHITLEKNLPVAAGIGGGSSDAAATLIACAALWNVDTSKIPAADVARALGADVPVCLAGRNTGAALMGGIGDAVIPAPTLPAAWLVLANPGAALSTPQVFGALNGRFGAAAPALPPSALMDIKALAAWLGAQRNDLAVAALELMPEIATVLAELSSAPGTLLARMSGSGPTCFGLFAEEKAADSAAAALAARNPAWWVKAAPLLAPVQSMV